MSDTELIAISAVATVYEARAGNAWIDLNGDWSSARIYTDLALAQSFAGRSYSRWATRAGNPVGPLNWMDRDGWWELYEDARPTGIEIDERFVFGPPGLAWIAVEKIEGDGS